MVLWILLTFFGCEEQIEPVKSPVSVTEAPKPKVPVYDMRISSPELIASWQEDTLSLAEKIEHPPEIGRYAELEAKFVVDATTVAAYLDVVEPVYEYQQEPETAQPTQTVEKPTVESAKQFEASQRHMDAGVQYAQLGDKVSAARCIKALEQKGEWNAAAVVAYEASDKPKLFAMLDKMAERADWDYRRRALVSRAIADKKMALATEIATHCGWDITKGDWDKDLVAMGDPKATRAVKERQLTRWIERVSADCRDENDVVVCGGPVWNEDYYYDLPMEAIVEYSKQDKAGALALAKTYLDSRYSSVWYRKYTNRRGPFICNLEFYKLVRSDTALKAAYLGKVRMTGTAYAQPETMEGSLYVDVQNPIMPFRCLQSVKALGDKDLTAAWTDYLTAALAARVDYTWREHERVGESVNDEKSQEKYVALGRHVLGVPGGSLTVIDPVLYGTISVDAFKAVWAELGLPVPEATLTLERVGEVAATAWSLKGKGFEAEALKTAQGVLGTASPEKIDDCLERLRLYEIYLSIPKGKTDEAHATIRKAIDGGREGFNDARKREYDAFLASFYLPYDVARHNRAEPGAEEKVYLTTDEKAEALVAPMLAELQVRASKAYTLVIDDLAKKEVRPLIDREVKRLTQAGETESLQRLLAVLPHNYNRDYWR
jgi:hypothetical protein